ncbi:hypothetical protein METBIDRAFT_36314 [Metschnikowia bicuspidata var. bicuspidata NRRL YB-4993]|uniref:Jacalin-type lectin domain-containing protein n=1 Tax=Metschnikowia bicuspidata var. bicuspidata NRRL YB-4993 TaxID=869754 RepID=A0A1A0HJY3_9ASCO|nr:hypothetical protein METBIDRAFT_36314 [Metschnikowia bicuspidata var. bicuspidata NRRL YB-4993]OBA24311.1 hypothetical protein METBIDRAFT_36314 [Metschnikowia bicuspidata var. bicuspidata NRRL YB-4993]
MIQFNYKDEIVSSPTVIVSGRVSTSDRGVIQFVNNDNSVFPAQNFEVNNSQFKALLHVSPNEPNHFRVSFWGGARISNTGVPTGMLRLMEEGSLTLYYYPLPDNKPVHLCVVMGRDSTGEYDMPKYKLHRGERANLDTAVQRLKVAGRMMQAFTQDEFHRLGLSNRSFQLVEETTTSQQLFGENRNVPAAHSEVKIHVLQSPKSVAELRDPDLAQQNPKAKNNGGLFSHAIDLIKASDLIKPYQKNNTPIQCAVMYLDSTWDGKLITTHAALGGGTGDVKLAIFGSHGLHSFPLTFPQMSPAFMDDTVLSIREVANDAKQCGTAWECLNICMGAFMHEIGHLLGSPHQVNGVMLRDYIWWNRLFMTREARCIRDGSPGSVIGHDGSFPKQCHWNILDIMRYFYHGSFSIPTDLNDPTFPKQASTLMKPPAGGAVPSMYVTSSGLVVVKSSSGIFMVELVGEDLARHHIKFYPQCYGGSGPLPEVVLNFEECLREFRKGFKNSADNFDVRVLSVTGDLWLPNFKSRCYLSLDSMIEHDFNLGRGPVKGTKSELLGSSKGLMRFVGFDSARVYKVRVYHGGALDGMSFYYHGNRFESETEKPPPLPKRSGWKTLFDGSAQKPMTAPNHFTSGEVTIGNQTRNFTDFAIPDNERIVKLSFRNGQWIDAVQIETDRGTCSPMLGNAKGGHLSVLEPPTPQHSIVGLYGYTGRWMDGIGILYAQL